MSQIDGQVPDPGELPMSLQAACTASYGGFWEWIKGLEFKGLRFGVEGFRV